MNSSNHINQATDSIMKNCIARIEGSFLVVSFEASPTELSLGSKSNYGIIAFNSKKFYKVAKAINSLETNYPGILVFSILDVKFSSSLNNVQSKTFFVLPESFIDLH